MFFNVFVFEEKNNNNSVLQARKAKQAPLALDFFRPYTAAPTDPFQSRGQNLYKLLGKKRKF